MKDSIDLQLNSAVFVASGKQAVLQSAASDIRVIRYPVNGVSYLFTLSDLAHCVITIEKLLTSARRNFDVILSFDSAHNFLNLYRLILHK